MLDRAIASLHLPDTCEKIRLYSGAAPPTSPESSSSALCILDLPSLVSGVVAESVSALPEVRALAAKCRTLIEAARTKNAFRAEFDAFSLRKLRQSREGTLLMSQSHNNVAKFSRVGWTHIDALLLGIDSKHISMIFCSYDSVPYAGGDDDARLRPPGALSWSACSSCSR